MAFVSPLPFCNVSGASDCDEADVDPEFVGASAGSLIWLLSRDVGTFSRTGLVNTLGILSAGIVSSAD